MRRWRRCAPIDQRVCYGCIYKCTIQSIEDTVRSNWNTNNNICTLQISLASGATSDSKANQLSTANEKSIDNNCKTAEIFSYVPLLLIFLSQFVLEIGIYYFLGQTYLDDNTKKGNSPLVLANALSLRMIGLAAVFLYGYFSLNAYIDPIKTPLIDNKDPRWLGWIISTELRD